MLSLARHISQQTLPFTGSDLRWKPSAAALDVNTSTEPTPLHPAAGSPLKLNYIILCTIIPVIIDDECLVL